MALLYSSDSRVKNNEKARQNALSETNKVYEQSMLNNEKVLAQNNAYADEYFRKNSEMLDAQTNLDIEKINQQKQKSADELNKTMRDANNSYIQSNNRYGAEAEARASGGLNNGGYVGMKQLTQYEKQQKTIGNARATTNQVVQELDNQISQARMTNDSKKAAYSLEVAKMKLEAEVLAMQKQSELQVNRLSSRQNINNTYDNLYMQIINQINAEKQRKQEKSQFNTQMKYQKGRDKIEDKHWKKEYDLQKKYS